MGDEFGQTWLSRLPWVILGRRTSFQPALDATAAELVLGENPVIPGDLVGEPGPPITGAKLKKLLEGLRKNAARPAVQTTHNRDAPVNNPDLSHTTHVFVKRGKAPPLGHSYDGPFQIVERLGTSCVKLRVGSFANGDPRYEVQHWHNLKPAVMAEDTRTAERAALGCKPLNHKAENLSKLGKCHCPCHFQLVLQTLLRSP